jgi:hypothetical protein
MGTFAETAIADYRLSFGQQRKTDLGFSFPLAENKQKFVVSIFRLQKTNRNCCFLSVPFLLARTCVCVFVHTYCIYIWIFIFIFICCGFKWKWKPRRFSLICLLFVHHAQGVCRWSICWQKKQMEVTRCKQTKWTKWGRRTKRIYSSM